MIEYKLNPAFSNEAITLHDLILIASYHGQTAITCQTKPPGSGIHFGPKRTVNWRLGNVTLVPGEEASHKVIAMLGGSEGARPQAGNIEARWEISSESKDWGSGLTIQQMKQDSKGKGKADESDPFADDTLEEIGERWAEVETVKRLTHAKYEAK